MTSQASNEHPSSVLARVDGSARSHRAIDIALAVGHRLGLPVGLDVVVSDADRRASIEDSIARQHRTLNAEPPDDRALVVTSLGRKRWSGPDAGPAAARPWIHVGRGLHRVDVRRFETFVVPIDGTPDLESLLGIAARCARPSGVRVSILAMAPAGPGPVREPSNPTPEQRFASDPRGYVDEVVESCQLDGLDLKIDVVQEPIGLASGLDSQLRSSPEAVVLMPFRRPRSVRRVVSGSTTSAVLTRSPVPVLVVPGTETVAGRP